LQPVGAWVQSLRAEVENVPATKTQGTIETEIIIWVVIPALALLEKNGALSVRSSIPGGRAPAITLQE
jgi:hypothetical protein